MSKKIITAITGIALLVGGGAVNAQIWVDSQGTSVDDANIDPDNRGARELLKGTDLSRGLDVGSLKIISPYMRKIGDDLKDLFGDQNTITASCMTPPDDVVYTGRTSTGELKLNYFTQSATNYGWGGIVTEGDDLNPNTWLVTGSNGSRWYDESDLSFYERTWKSYDYCISYNCGGSYITEQLIPNRTFQKSAELAVEKAFISAVDYKKVSVETDLRLSLEVDLMSGYSIKAYNTDSPDDIWSSPLSIDLADLKGDLGPSHLIYGSGLFITPLSAYNGVVFSPLKFSNNDQSNAYTMAYSSGNIHGYGEVQTINGTGSGGFITSQLQIKSVEHMKLQGKFTNKIKLSIKTLKAGGTSEYASAPLSEFYGGYAIDNPDSIGTISYGNKIDPNGDTYNLPNGTGLKYTGPGVTPVSPLLYQLKEKDDALKTIICTLQKATTN